MVIRLAITLSLSNSNTSSNVLEILRLNRTDTDSAGAAGLGAAIDWTLEDSASTANEAAQLDVVWTDATDTSEDADFVFNTMVAGTLTEAVRVTNGGVEFNESDANPTCAADNFNIYADLSEQKLKKCVDGVATDLDTNSTSDFIFKAKSADQGVTNSATLTDETALQFTIPASEEWNVIWQLQVTNGNNAGPDWKSAVVNAGSTCTATLTGTESTGLAWIAQTTTTDCIEAPGALINGTILADASIPFQVIMYANITGDATPDAVKMQFAHNTATAGVALTVKAGSTMTAYKVTGADLAESYYTKDGTIMAGDVVTIDSTIDAGVKKTDKAYDSGTIGVISTKPGIVLGDSSNVVDRPVFVALSGRVPVKVTTENGPIKPGDYLAASSTPGAAMKATKAGAIIGQAMTAFDGDGLGAVKVFIKNGQGNGAKLADILSGVSHDAIQELTPDLSKTALAQFISQKAELAAATDLSEILTDRLSAAAEIITPSVTTQTVALESIQALDKEVTLNLGEDGKFVITNEATGEDTIAFDNNGNATFAGTVTADVIKARQIEGMEIFTDKLTQLSQQVEGMTTMSPTPSSTPTTTPTTMPFDSAQGKPTITPGSFQKNEQVVDLAVLGKLEVAGGLIVTGTAEFRSLVTFAGDIEITGRPTFNNDTAGMAKIAKGAQRVEVIFEKEYAEAPIVSANVTFDKGQNEEANQALEERIFAAGYNHLVTRRSTKGFSIVLNKPAEEDITFSWVALAVKNMKTHESGEKNGEEEAIPSDPTPVPEETPVPATATPELSASPEPTPEPTPSPTP